MDHDERRMKLAAICLAWKAADGAVDDEEEPFNAADAEEALAAENVRTRNQLDELAVDPRAIRGMLMTEADIAAHDFRRAMGLRCELLSELVRLQALDVAQELIGELQVDEARTDCNFHLIEEVARHGDVPKAKKLALAAFAKDVWTFCRLRVAIYKIAPSQEALDELRETLKRATGNEYPRAVARVESFVRLWAVTRAAEDVTEARNTALKMTPYGRGLAYKTIAKSTHDREDYLAAVRAFNAHVASVHIAKDEVEAAKVAMNDLLSSINALIMLRFMVSRDNSADGAEQRQKYAHCTDEWLQNIVAACATINPSWAHVLAKRIGESILLRNFLAAKMAKPS